MPGQTTETAFETYVDDKEFSDTAFGVLSKSIYESIPKESDKAKSRLVLLNIRRGNHQSAAPAPFVLVVEKR